MVGFRPMRSIFLLGSTANEYLARNAANFRWQGGFELLIPLAGATALLVSDGPGHDRRRRLVEPALHRDRLERYVEHTVRHTDRVIDSWRPGQVVDAYQEFRGALRRSTISGFFGERLAADDATIGANLQLALDPLNRSLPRQKLMRAIPNRRWRRAMRAVADVDAKVRSEIAHRHAATDREDDLLTMLLPEESPDGGLTDDELRDMIVSLIVASFDTTSAAVGWAIYAMLANDGVFSAARQSVTEKAGPRPDYLDRVISESLRLYPPVIAGARAAVEAFDFQGYRIPAGSLVVSSQFVSHRDPGLWPEPDRFRPERWDPGSPEYRKPSRYEYLPFGAGYRRCPGSSVANANIRAVLTRLLQRTELVLTKPDVGFAGLSAMYPRGGVQVRVERADG